MSELGATSDPRALIPGSPEAIEENVIAIRGRGESMIRAGEGLQRIDTGAWGGQAADAFRDKFSYEPPKWLTAGDSFDAASIALAGYADTLRWAQRQATQAIVLWEEGEAATRQAQSQHNAAVAQTNAENLANAAAGIRLSSGSRPSPTPGRPLARLPGRRWTGLEHNSPKPVTAPPGLFEPKPKEHRPPPVEVPAWRRGGRRRPLSARSPVTARRTPRPWRRARTPPTPTA